MTNSEPAPVRAWTEEVVIPTYLPAPPDKNPMFLEKRVYQGSSGKVYPLPFTDRIEETKTDRPWKVVWMENEFLRVMILPELGGRIHRIVDKTNGYDAIYHQPVIKPALVGLAGPWISGGIEFNWPQHHRPATFLPVDFTIEEHADGSKTVWCSDHDPMARMKGMHGVCLHPGRAYVQLKVRAYNRTPLPQTFLWWANVATRVHESYQSFFPPDVYYVADHAKRAMSRYPLCEGFYYGINYGERAKAERSRAYVANDLSWYGNIVTPCSYMCMGSKDEFFGGYDHKAQAGIIHVANHHISPGKKQWTWGNHPFGYAWDRNLTDATPNGEFPPYIELMAGVYTDNQPDFSFLEPGETKAWSQYWYPIQKIGPSQKANLDAALSVQLQDTPLEQRIRIGINVTRVFTKALIRLRCGTEKHEWRRTLAPGKPTIIQLKLTEPLDADAALAVQVFDANGGEILSYTRHPSSKLEEKVPQPATEPLPPAKIASADELYVTGLHLEQYRHATRCPTDYWREALRRDPLDSRCNNALGLWHLRRGEFQVAENHFRRAIERLTRRNPNPRDGEPFYNLGLALRYQADARPELLDDAYAAFYKGTWNHAWCAAGFHALAEIDCRRGDWATALDHLNRSLPFDTENLRARNLKVIVLRKLAHDSEATALLDETLRLDPLDWWARHLKHEPLSCDLQTVLDIAHDFARAGFCDEAIALLEQAAARERLQKDLPTQSTGAEPLLYYTLGSLHARVGDHASAAECCARGASASPDYCFPARLEEIAVLEHAMRIQPNDARAPYYLGNLFYDRRRYDEAIQLWERSASLDPSFPTVWRNLGIAYFNVRHSTAKARRAYDKAFVCGLTDARLLYERDQLWKRTGESPAKRLRELERHLESVRRRDDLSIELCALHNQTGSPEKALEVLGSRKFQPWEGGEGQALGQHVRTHLALGRKALQAGDAAAARDEFSTALTSPENLGEAKHILANQSDIFFWLGCAWEKLGDIAKAREHWTEAAMFKGDFQEMSVRSFSEMTYYSALAWQKLGNSSEATKLLKDLLAYARRLARTPAKIDYFATSLPAMLLFNDDLNARQKATALFLEAQARLGLGDELRAKRLLKSILKRDPNHALAADLIAGF